jgi:AcrR family transcriptional regulator
MASQPHAGAASAPERERIKAATINLLAEYGYEHTTLEMVVGRAGVDRAEFGRHFVDMRDCALQVYGESLEGFVDLVLAASAEEENWRDAMRAAGYAVARFLRDNQRIARFGVIQMLGAGSAAEVLRTSSLDRLVDLIDAGRQELDDPGSVTRAVAEGLLGSVYEIVIRDLQRGKGTKDAEDVVPQFLYFIMRPYLGHEVAREELTLPPPPESSEEGG